MGRPSKLSLGEVDPTGTYCPVPDDWLNSKYGKNVLIYRLNDMYIGIFIGSSRLLKKEMQFFFFIFGTV